MRTTVQQKHTDGAIATLLRTALANRHDGSTKAYHQTLNTLRLAIEDIAYNLSNKIGATR